jgi:hypothetical protein
MRAGYLLGWHIGFGTPRMEAVGQQPAGSALVVGPEGTGGQIIGGAGRHRQVADIMGQRVDRS